MDPPSALRTPSSARRSTALVAYGALGTAGAFGLVLTGSRLGALPSTRWPGWWFAVPHMGTDVLGVVFYLCVLAMVVAWLGVGRSARAGELTTAWACLILAAWALPLLIGPPLFSRDLYSYVGQGLLAQHGLDPYRVGPNALGHGQLLSAIATPWRADPAPYGPLFVLLAKATSAGLGGSLVAQVIALRVLEVGGVALLVAGLPRLARRMRVDPGTALWIGVLSPLALFSFIASGHNDALMLGLLVIGVALWLEGRRLPGLALCSLAAAVKLPPLAVIAFLAAVEFRSSRPGRRAAALWPFVVVPAVTLGALTWVSGLGWAWLGPMALRVPAELRTLTTPAVSIGVLVSHVLRGVGLLVGQSTTVTVVRTLCSVVGLVVGGWLLVTARRADVVRTMALALLVVVLTGPTLWPWYLLWGMVFLAATPLQRSPALVVAAALAMVLVGPSGTPVVVGDAYLAVAAAVLAGIVWLVRGGRWRALARGEPTLARGEPTLAETPP